jgi:translation elongation factor EF-1beta
MISIIIFNKVKSQLKKHGIILKNRLYINFNINKLIIDEVSYPTQIVDIEEIKKSYKQIKDISEIEITIKKIRLVYNDGKETIL